jgi:hypothetical protein
MSIHVGRFFNTSDGPQLAIVELGDDLNQAVTVAVISETDADGLTPGQVSFKHDVPRGTEPGSFHGS